MWRISLWFYTVHLLICEIEGDMILHFAVIITLVIFVTHFDFPSNICKRQFFFSIESKWVKEGSVKRTSTYRLHHILTDLYFNHYQHERFVDIIFSHIIWRMRIIRISHLMKSSSNNILNIISMIRCRLSFSLRITAVF